MRIDEKLRLLNGRDFWTTYGSEALGIREIVFADGPTGLRFQSGEQDHLGLNDSSPATCFPTSSAISCSWNPALVEEVASCIAREAAEKGVDVVLAPGINIKRSPLCGRNFEYYSEDPYLTKELGAAFVNGLQKNGIGASLKHFAANNQEAYRMSVDTLVDDRTLHEIYLRAFEEIIKETKPWTVMSAYNRLLGDYCSENKWLLTDLLRDSWGFDGLIISDWHAVNDIVKSINSGLDLEMPSVGDLSFNLLKEAYEGGKLDKAAIDRAVGKIKALAEKCSSGIKASLEKPNFKKHHEVARRAASESAVLLKNNRNTLPLRAGESVLFVGELMNNPVIQGNGSSRVNPIKIDSIPAELANAGIPFSFEPGYRIDEEAAGGTVDEELVSRAVEAARGVEKIVVFAGLFNFMEAESYDRESLNLPVCQEYLIEKLSSLGKELVVVLQTGSAVVMPWLDKADSVLQLGLSGQGAAKALVDVLSGKVNPGGRLTETYPLKPAHIPSYLHRGTSTAVQYGESIFTGYMYYDKKELEVLFPFGHGLSYTEFEYDGLKVAKSGEEVQVSLMLKNKGHREGSEVVQLYIGLNENNATQPVRKLAAFRKVFLEPGESREVGFVLHLSDFKYYSAAQKEFIYATGINTIEIGKSSRNIVLMRSVEISEDNRKYSRVNANTTIGELLAVPALRDTAQSRINELAAQLGIDNGGAVNPKELEKAMFYLPLRNIVQISCGAFSYEDLKDFINHMNGILET